LEDQKEGSPISEGTKAKYRNMFPISLNLEDGNGRGYFILTQYFIIILDNKPDKVNRRSKMKIAREYVRGIINGYIGIC
jgi:hypothetical protein